MHLKTQTLSTDCGFCKSLVPFLILDIVFVTLIYTTQNAILTTLDTSPHFHGGVERPTHPVHWHNPQECGSSDLWHFCGNLKPTWDLCWPEQVFRIVLTVLVCFRTVSLERIPYIAVKSHQFALILTCIHKFYARPKSTL